MRRSINYLRQQWLLLCLLPLFGYLVIYPLIVVILRSLEDERGDGGPTLQNFRRVLTSRRFHDMLVNTGIIVVLGVTLSLIVGSLLAWLIERTDLPGRRLLSQVPLAPLFVSPLVMSIGFVFLLDPSVGYVNSALRWLPLIDGSDGPINIYSVWGIGLSLGVYATSYVYPYVRAGLANMDSSLEEAARVGGASPFTVLRTVTVPLLKPSLLAAGLLSLIVTVAEYAIPSVLGSRRGVNTVSTEIVRYISQYPASPASGAALSLLVMAVTLLMLIPVHRALNQTHRYEVVGRGTQGVTELGRWRWVWFAFVVGFVAVAAVLPLLAIAFVAVTKFWSPTISTANLTLEHVRTILFDDDRTWLSISNSLKYSFIAATIAVALAFIISYFRRFQRGKVATTVDVLGTIPLGVPSVILGVGFLFVSLRGPFVLYGTAGSFILAYTAKFVPLAIRALGASFSQVKTELMEASRVCGAGPVRSILRILFPLSAPGVQAGWLLMVIVMLREYPMSILLFNRDTTVMSVNLYRLMEGGLYGRAASFALLLFVVGVLVTSVAIVAMSPFQRWTRRTRAG